MQIADFGMSRELMDESYYVSHGGKVPVKWTAPEVCIIDIHVIMMLFEYLNRLFITRSTPPLVMCGAMEPFSTRYGV